jgi:hypothetical protein
VTIHESEEDVFRSECHRNRNRKGFNDTKWKSNYYGMARTKVWIANRTREIRPSGMKRGAFGNVSVMGGKADNPDSLKSQCDQNPTYCQKRQLDNGAKNLLSRITIIYHMLDKFYPELPDKEYAPRP